MRTEAATTAVPVMDLWDKLAIALAVSGCLVVGWAALAWGV
jgi:hypothetical protein